MRVAILGYDVMTALDGIGPYDVLNRVPGADVRWVAIEPGPKRTEAGGMAILVENAAADLPDPDIVVIPGGFGTRALLEDEPTLDWIRRAHDTSKWTTSVCTGSLLLAAAGLLDDTDATTHWLWRDLLASLGAKPIPDRVVRRGKIVTAAGVSSGIDMALTLVREEYGPELSQAIQLGIEYDPQPPFDAGSPEKAPPEIVEAVRTAATAQAAEATQA